MKQLCQCTPYLPVDHGTILTGPVGGVCINVGPQPGKTVDSWINVDNHDVYVVETVSQNLERFVAATGMCNPAGFHGRIRNHAV